MPDTQKLGLLHYCGIDVTELSFHLQLDVFGLCPTDFSFSERGDTTMITKTRNLNECQLREHMRQDFASITYNVDSVSIYTSTYIK
jgi:hypothetical protein